MKQTLTTTRKRGDTITIGDSQIEIVECDRGRVRVKVIHEDTTPVEVKNRGNKVLQLPNQSI